MNSLVLPVVWLALVIVRTEPRLEGERLEGWLHV